MSSHSDSELKLNNKHKKKNHLHISFKAKDKIDTDILQALKVIIKRGHTPNIKESRLLSAVGTNNTEMVQQLLESNVNSNSMDSQQRSALHLAVSRGYVDVVRMLLEHGADANMQDIIGNTPLHLAACTNNIQIITLLLNAGADVGSLDIHGRNPLQLAETKLQMLQRSWRSGNIEMVLLRRQLQQVIDLMISLWKRQTSPTSIQLKRNIDDLEIMKLSLNSNPVEQVDDQLSKLLSKLQDFSIK